MEKETDELYGIVMWDDRRYGYTMCLQHTANFIQRYVAGVHGTVVVDNLPRKEAEALLKLLPRPPRY